MAYRNAKIFILGANILKTKQREPVYGQVLLHHLSEETQEEVFPSGWYEKTFPRISNLLRSLKNVDVIDGRLVRIGDDDDDCIPIFDDDVKQRMTTCKSYVRAFIGSGVVQEAMKRNVEAQSIVGRCTRVDCFGKLSERQPMMLKSLTSVSDFLNISAQQRKGVRLTICPQVTQHRIWTGTLGEVLNELKSDLVLLDHDAPSRETKMCLQIVASCIGFLHDTANSGDPNSTSWMHLVPSKKDVSPTPRTWEDVLEMFDDLLHYLNSQKWLSMYIVKLMTMKEGLNQIKDVLVDKNVAYKEVRHQESLVQKKLSKTLGHSSRCLFMLLLYYLYGNVRNIELDLCGGLYSAGDTKRFCLCLGRILTSDEEKMVWSGMKQLDKALGLYKFLWETAKADGFLELQGHLWCIGAEDRTLTYRGNLYFIHGINL